jgi:YidC/Oxa1 family membrane protein insertase
LVGQILLSKEAKVDRRFFAWMLLTLSLFMLWSSMNQRNEIRKKEEELQAQELKKKKERDAERVKDKAAQAIANADVPPPPDVPTSWHTLGSFHNEDGYRLVVTLTSKGAGVERVELVEQSKPGRFKYRSLAHRGGYLGYLAGEEEKEGLRIRSIAKGSPAALAESKSESADVGLRAGDLITQIDDVEIHSETDLNRHLAKQKPRETVQLKVLRPNGEQETTPLIFSIRLSEAPLDIIRDNDAPLEDIPGNLPRYSLMTTLSKVDDTEAIPGNKTIPGLEATFDNNWLSKTIEVDHGMGVEFTLPLQSYLAGAGIKANLELVKRYRLYKGDAKLDSNAPASPKSVAYHLDVEAVVRNLDDSEHEVAVRQESTTGLTLEAWWYAIKLSQNFSAAGARDVILARGVTPHEIITRRDIQEYARSHPDQPDNSFFGPDYPLDKRSFRYLGVDQQYFTSVILPHPDSPNVLDNLSQGATSAIADMRASVAYKDIGTNVGFWFDSSTKMLEAKSEFSQRYQVYLGPKDPVLLEAYGLGGSVYYGWAIFGWVAKPLSLFLHTFYSIVRNYGIAIMMLTVLVRSCMFPLSRRAAIMGQRMQEMQPEMKRINELYKDDMAKRGQEMQALYKKYKLNPMASCLPVFVQIPIFIGLYRCVSTDIELRQQPLIPGLDWCSNLAGPDMLASFPSWMPDFIAGKGSGWFGPYFNLLPILTIALFIIQQKVLMPKATDEQTRMTQQMMMVMTVFMGVLFFKVPAGLCIYFITSSIWSLIERRLIKKFIPALVPAADGVQMASSNSSMSNSHPRPKTSTKSPETLSDVMDSVKNLWSKTRKEPEVTLSPETIAARKKKRKKK